MLPRWLHVWLTMLGFDGGRYVLAAGGAFLVFRVAGRRRWRHKRIFPERLTWPNLRREVAYSASTALVFSMTGTALWYGTRAGYFRMYSDVGLHGSAYLVLTLLLLPVLHDAYFYWTHRAMHARALFRGFHLVHHLSTNPTPWAAYAFAPGEAVVQAAFVPLVALVLPIHDVALFGFLAFMITRNVLGHLGLELFPRGFTRSRVWGWSTTATHHAMHHRHMGSNYGLYFMYWDRWMGTLSPEYEATFERVASRRPRARSARSGLRGARAGAVGLAVAAAILAFAGTASAGETTTLKIGSLAPAESPWGQVFKVWARGLEQRTDGAMSLGFYWNGQQGDEGAMVAKMRTGQLDGAALTATGLSMIYKSVLVLQLPALFRTWEKLDAARAALRPGFDAEFEKQGFRVLGWGDVGMAHLMTRGAVVRVPADLQHRGCFFLPGDPIGPAFYSIVNATAKAVSVPEILTGLTSHTIDVVTAPALVAEQLQWASRLDHMNTAVAGIGIGALVMTSARIKGLPADGAAALLETGKVAGEALTVRVRREDAAAYARLRTRMTTYDLTAEEEGLWAQAFTETARRLRGTSFEASVFDAAVALGRP